jgi:hypothetical protein
MVKLILDAMARILSECDSVEITTNPISGLDCYEA